MAMYAVVRIRGSMDVSHRIKDTLRMLNLKAVNNCVLVPKTADFEGMLENARPYVTWGEVKPDTVEKLVLKRGRLPGDKRLEPKQAKEISKNIVSKNTVKESGIKPVFKLSPPRKGLRTVKLAFPKGDAGFRGDKINELLERMI